MTIYSKTQAAKTLGISPRTLDRYREEGKAPYRKIGDRVIFTESDLSAFLDACAVPAMALPSDRESKEMTKAFGRTEGGAAGLGPRNELGPGGAGDYRSRAGG